MAFMMPVMKNNYDIYKDTRSRSRKTSECSNTSSGNATTALASALGTPNGIPGTVSASAAQQQRRRKVSECKSESFATSPSHGQLGAHRMQMQRCHSSRGFTRNASRSSHNGSMLQMSAMMSPTRSSPPSRTQTASALERQAAAQCAAQTAAAVAAAATTTATMQQHRAEQSNNDYTKFHTRLVEKLRKSFRKDNGKRS
ncbi:uncharacterized protein LOC117793420 [Drosophila innubila]|uniref:uncharacterized protein LOC117793420 n=1 Tax=Drosophila innubila TaxID=198719 RepID=UPI00148D9FEC|nr:uncharacterized protein LOC117793420 [Drosophila innubila]